MNRYEYKVSVVIAHYNTGNYIRKALDSLVRQTMNQDDFEVVIVDDKSNKLLNIIQEYESQLKHLRIVVEEQNHGYPSIPRNHEIAKARGTFIILMDQDDNLADDTLLNLLAMILMSIFANMPKVKCITVHKSPLRTARTLTTRAS